MPGSSAGSTSIFRNCRGVFLSPPKVVPSILTIQGTRHPTIWGCPQGEVGFTIAAKNQRPGKQRWKWNCSSRYPRVDLAKTEHRAQRIVEATNMAWRKTVLSEDQNDVEVDHTEREHQAEMLTRATAYEPRKSGIHSSKL